MHRFERLEAWQRANALAIAIYRATAEWPTSQRYILSAQIPRAAVSVASNIAEGATRRGPREFCRFLEIAQGSLAEVTCLLGIARQLGYLKPDAFDQLNKLREEVSKLTWGLYRAMHAASQRSKRPAYLDDPELE